MERFISLYKRTYPENRQPGFTSLPVEKKLSTRKSCYYSRIRTGIPLISTSNSSVWRRGETSPPVIFDCRWAGGPFAARFSPDLRSAKNPRVARQRSFRNFRCDTVARCTRTSANVRVHARHSCPPENAVEWRRKVAVITRSSIHRPSATSRNAKQTFIRANIRANTGIWVISRTLDKRFRMMVIQKLNERARCSVGRGRGEEESGQSRVREKPRIKLPSKRPRSFFLLLFFFRLPLSTACFFSLVAHTTPVLSPVPFAEDDATAWKRTRF